MFFATKHDLPFADETFDAVVCSLSVEYLIAPQQVLSEIVFHAQLVVVSR